MSNEITRLPVSFTADPSVVQWRSSLQLEIAAGFSDCVDALFPVILDYLIPVAIQLPPMEFVRDQRSMVYLRSGPLQPVMYRVATIQSLPPVYNLRRNQLVLVVQPFTYDYDLLELQYLRHSTPNATNKSTLSTGLLQWGMDRCQMGDELLKQLDQLHTLTPPFRSFDSRIDRSQMEALAEIVNTVVRPFDASRWYQTRLIVVARHADDCKHGCCRAPNMTRMPGYPPPLTSVQFPIPSPLTANWLCCSNWSISQLCDYDEFQDSRTRH